MRTRWIVKIAAGALALAIVGCGGSGITGLGARTYLGTQAPGDVWDWTISNGTFTATNETTTYTYSGVETVLPTGFMKLVVGATTDPGVTVGQSAYAIEMPGTALVIKPAGDDAKAPIIAASLGSNPAGPTVSFNFVQVPSATWASTDQAYGHVDFAVTGNNYDGTSIRFEIDGTPMADGPSHFVGDNGRMTDLNGPGGVTATGSMTPSGVCAIDYGPNAGGVIGVKQPTNSVDLTVIGGLSYRGFLINSGKTQCVTCTPNGDGTLHGVGYANPGGVETGTSDGGSGVTVTFLQQVNPGQIMVNIATSGGSETLIACVAQVGGKYMLFCFGAGTGNNNQPYNVLLVQN